MAGNNPTGKGGFGERPQEQTDATERQVCLARNGADELQEVER